MTTSGTGKIYSVDEVLVQITRTVPGQNTASVARIPVMTAPTIAIAGLYRKTLLPQRDSSVKLDEIRGAVSLMRTSLHSVHGQSRQAAS